MKTQIAEPHSHGGGPENLRFEQVPAAAAAGSGTTLGKPPS